MLRLVKTLRYGCLILMSACAACAGQSSQPGSPGTDQAAAQAAHVPFPVDRAGSTLSGYTVLGKDAAQTSAGATVVGNSLVLTSAANGAEYAIYRYNPGDPPDHVDVVLDDPQTSAAFIGVADYTAQQWVFSGPFTATQTVALDPARNVSPLGNRFIAIVVARGATAQIDALRLFTENGWVVAAPGPAPGPNAIGSSMVVVSGNPAICYVDVDNQLFKFVRATTPDGSAWGTPVTLDGTAGAGGFNSLAIVNGNPAVSYVGSATLKYVRASDAAGAAWGPPVIVDGVNTVGWYTSLAVAAGSPAISYFDSVNKTLLFVRSTDAAGTAWGGAQIVDASGEVGQFNSLEIVDGNPAVSYSDNTPTLNALMYVRALTPGGALWGPVLQVDNVNNNGIFNALAVINGNPAICYHDFSFDLRYVRALDADGVAWGVSTVVDSDGDNVGWNSSLRTIGGKPAISYTESTSAVLRYVEGADADGAAWGAPLDIDAAAAGVGCTTSLTTVAGKPAVSYFDGASPSVLKFIRLS